MTKRAILWCGHVRGPHYRRDEFGRWTESGDDPVLAVDDFKIQANGLDLAFSAARALGVAPDDVHACLVDDDLKPQGLRTRTYRATAADLRRLVRTIEARARPGDPLLFIAVNHGAKEGLVTADPVPLDEFEEAVPPKRLTPEILEECLGPLMGPQVIVVATCYAGVFLPMGTDNRAVLASCSEEEYYVRRQDCAWSAFLDELFGAWCASALSDAIPRERLSLDEAFERARDRLASARARNVPQRAGNAVWPE